MLNNKQIATYEEVREQQDWMIGILGDGLAKLIEEGKEEKESLGSRFREAVKNRRRDPREPLEPGIDEFRKLTIQADEEVDFLTVKKIMYTATESGIEEINFAVIKKPTKENL